MKLETASLLRSPVTGEDLRIEVFEADGDDVVAGRLIEPATGAWYRIEEGIADLAPPEFQEHERHDAFRRRHHVKGSAAETVPGSADAHTLAQMAFFAKYHERYEKQVVDSPYYRALNEVTFCRWARRNLDRGDRVVEIGCGSGRQTLPMLDQGLDVIALDLSEEMLRLARAKALDRKGPGHADFVRGVAERVPVRSASARAAVICSSLHHFTDPGAAIREAARVMGPGARFFLLEPHDSPVRFLFDWLMRVWRLWEEEASDEPLFAARQLQSWLGEAGIEAAIRYSTYLPPHLFHWVGAGSRAGLLARSDRLFGRIPGIRGLAGVIMAEGVRRSGEA